MTRNASYVFKVTQLTTALVPAGATEHIGTAIDMTGFESVMFVTACGIAASTSATFYVKLQGASGTTETFTDIAGSTATFDTGNDDSIVIQEVHRPLTKALRPVFERASANTTINGAWAFQFNPSESGVTQSTFVADTVVLVSPTTG